MFRYVLMVLCLVFGARGVQAQSAEGMGGAVDLETLTCEQRYPDRRDRDFLTACRQLEGCRSLRGDIRAQCQERALASSTYVLKVLMDLKGEGGGGHTTIINAPTKTATVGLQFALLGGFDWSSGALGNGTLRLEILKGVEVVEGDGDIVVIGAVVVGVSNTHDLNWVLGARLAAGYRFEFDPDTRLAVLIDGGYTAYPNSPTLQGVGSDRWDFGPAVRLELWKLVIEGYGGFESFSSLVASGRAGGSWISGLRIGGAISF